MMMPAMMSAKVMMPMISTRSCTRSALVTIQLTFRAIAAATRRTQNATKNAIAFWRRVIPAILRWLGYRFVDVDVGDDQPVVLFVGDFLRDPRHLDVPRQAERPQRAD